MLPSRPGHGRQRQRRTQQPRREPPSAQIARSEATERQLWRERAPPFEPSLSHEFVKGGLTLGGSAIPDLLAITRPGASVTKKRLVFCRFDWGRLAVKRIAIEADVTLAEQRIDRVLGKR